MYRAEVVLNNEVGLHARPASLLVKESTKYKSDIKIIKEGKEYNAKSIMAIISMGANKGTKLTITAEGVDEKEVVLSLKDLIENKLKS